MGKLTPEMYYAMLAHFDGYKEMNPNRCKTERGHVKHWREHLTNAWLKDWREQWGTLRTIRNQVGIAEALDQFDAIRTGRTHL